MKRRSGGAAGKILTLLLLLCGAGTVYLLYNTNLLPVKYLALITAGAVVLILLVGFLTWDFHSRGKFVLGLFLWFAVLMVFAVAVIYVRQTHSTMAEITSAEKEVSAMGVFVKTDNAASSLPETSGVTYGVLRTLDRENTDAALSRIQEQTGTAPETAEYDGLTELVDSVVSDETGAIILNEAYLDVIRELDGYQQLDSMIKEIATENVETEVKRPAQVVQTQGQGTGNSADGASDADASDSDDSGTEEVALAQTAPPVNNKDVIVIYVSGIDNRGGIVAKSRSDVNIVAVANLGTHQMLLINTPRD